LGGFSHAYKGIKNGVQQQLECATAARMLSHSHGKLRCSTQAPKQQLSAPLKVVGGFLHVHTIVVAHNSSSSGFFVYTQIMLLQQQKETDSNSAERRGCLLACPH
jgi:hypothetical protein